MRFKDKRLYGDFKTAVTESFASYLSLLFGLWERAVCHIGHTTLVIIRLLRKVDPGEPAFLCGERFCHTHRWLFHPRNSLVALRIRL